MCAPPEVHSKLKIEAKQYVAMSGESASQHKLLSQEAEQTNTNTLKCKPIASIYGKCDLFSFVNCIGNSIRQPPQFATHPN